MEHENSSQHKQSMINYVAISKTTDRFDSGLIIQCDACHFLFMTSWASGKLCYMKLVMSKNIYK